MTTGKSSTKSRPRTTHTTKGMTLKKEIKTKETRIKNHKNRSFKRITTNEMTKSERRRPASHQTSPTLSRRAGPADRPHLALAKAKTTVTALQAVLLGALRTLPTPTLARFVADSDIAVGLVALAELIFENTRTGPSCKGSPRFQNVHLAFWPCFSEGDAPMKGN